MQTASLERPVLLVEDDEAIRESLTELLESEGYRVITARNGLLALDYLGGGDELPAVILLDLMMPVMSGLELLEALPSLPDAEARGVPIVVLTASRERPLVPPVIASLRKPIDVDELLGVLARAVGRA